jgi:hypothetical protein
MLKAPLHIQKINSLHGNAWNLHPDFVQFILQGSGDILRT